MQNEFDFSNLPRHAMVVGVLVLAAWFTKPSHDPQPQQQAQGHQQNEAQRSVPR